MSIPRSSVKTIGLIAAVSMAAAAVMLGGHGRDKHGDILRSLRALHSPA